MNIMKAVFLSIVFMSIPCFANIIHIQKWTNPATHQKLIVAGDIHTLGVNNQQEHDLQRLVVDEKPTLLLEWIPEFDDAHHPDYQLACTYKEMWPDFYGDRQKQLLGRVHAMACAAGITSKELDCRLPLLWNDGWWHIAATFLKDYPSSGGNWAQLGKSHCKAVQSAGDVIEAYKKSIAAMPSDDLIKAQLLRCLDPLDILYQDIQRETAALRDTIIPAAQDSVDAFYHQFGLLLQQATLTERDGRLFVRGNNMWYRLDDLYTDLLELNIVMNVLCESSPTILVVCGAGHVKNITPLLSQLGYQLEKDLSNTQAAMNSLRAAWSESGEDTAMRQEYASYCIDITKFLSA